MFSAAPLLLSATDVNDPDVRVGAVVSARAKVARDRIKAKMTRIVDMISAEQIAKEGEPFDIDLNSPRQQDCRHH